VFVDARGTILKCSEAKTIDEEIDASKKIDSRNLTFLVSPQKRLVG